MADYDPSAPTFDAGDEGYDNGDDQYDPQADGDEDDDYDPTSFNADASTPAATTEQQEAPKEKTVGGFIVDDEDEEEDAAQPPPSQMNGIEGAQSGLGAAAVAQAQDVPPVASDASQDLAAQNAGLNGPAQPSVVSASHTPSNVSTTASFQAPAPAPASQSATADQQGKQELQPTTEAASVSQSAAATPQPPQASTSAPQQGNDAVPATPTARLPHDKVGQLEDRIKEDPRADTDAWMSLIAHYKEKGQFDQMRGVYERFFKVFPNAVCSRLFLKNPDDGG